MTRAEYDRRLNLASLHIKKMGEIRNKHPFLSVLCFTKQSIRFDAHAGIATRLLNEAQEYLTQPKVPVREDKCQ